MGLRQPPDSLSDGPRPVDLRILGCTKVSKNPTALIRAEIE
jgi:hypothetical protein